MIFVDKDKKNTNNTAKKETNKSPIIPSPKKEAEFYKENLEENKTIMPTMLDESEEKAEKARDLSAIIPKFEDNSENENATELVSRDNIFKSDASITIAYVNEEGEATMNAGAKIPDQIDMEQRKKEIADSKNVRKRIKKEKRDRRKARRTKKQQNIIAYGSLFTMIALGIFGYWFFNHKTDMDFMPKNITLELGSELPVHKSSYIIPGVGSPEDLDEIYYDINTDELDLEHVGEYPYTVTYKNVTKTGKIKIEDTTTPELSVRNITITEGDQYDAKSFVDMCTDHSGCNFSFQDEATVLKYTTEGSYVVYIVATDAYGNSTTKKASLIIEAEANVRRYVKESNYDPNLGYEVIETYDLRFRELQDDPILLRGTYTRTFKYQDVERFEKESKQYNGESGYIVSSSDMTITYRQSTGGTIGNNYSFMSHIESYLTSQGFRRER